MGCSVGKGNVVCLFVFLFGLFVGQLLFVWFVGWSVFLLVWFAGWLFA